MILLVHLKILRSTISKIPGFQDLAESISSIQGQKNQGPFPGPKFKSFSRIPGFPGLLATPYYKRAWEMKYLIDL